jgi:hypothetical protein
MGTITNAYKSICGKNMKGRDNLGQPDVYSRIILKRIL